MKRENNNPSQRRDKHCQMEVKIGDALEHFSFCGKNGHSREGCFKRIGYLECWSGNWKKQESKPKAVCIETSPISGLTATQYETFLKHFEEKGGINKEHAKLAT